MGFSRDGRGWLGTYAHVVDPAYRMPPWVLNELKKEAIDEACVEPALKAQWLMPAQVIAAIESGDVPVLLDVRSKMDFETSQGRPRRLDQRPANGGVEVVPAVDRPRDLQ